VSLIATGKNPKIDLLLAKRPPRADWKPNRANFWEARPFYLFVCYRQKSLNRVDVSSV
jgi:hypothetical protein